jgi:hypothetical protein
VISTASSHPPSSPPLADGHRPLLFLLAAAALTALAFQFPAGRWALYPFTLLATWFHEMGHGVTALVLGGQFDRLEIFRDGSGLAHWSGVGFGRLASAAVAAGGPLGPALAGAALILAGRSRAATRVALGVLGAALLLSNVLWVRTAVGFVAVALWGVAVLGAAAVRGAGLRALAVQLLGVQACISTYRQVGYLFTRAVVLDGEARLSDTGQIAAALFLPHWVWGALLTVGCAALLLASLALAYRGAGPPALATHAAPAQVA